MLFDVKNYVSADKFARICVEEKTETWATQYAVPTSFYQQQLGYSLATYTNYYSLCQEFARGEQLENPEEVLEEDLYILERLEPLP